MIRFKCVKCGTTVQTDDPEYNRYPWRAPSCNSCREDVIEETARESSMLPRDWHGRWLWPAEGHEWVYWEEEKKG